MRIYFTTNDDCEECAGAGFSVLDVATYESQDSFGPGRVLCKCAVQRVSARAGRFDSKKGQPQE